MIGPPSTEDPNIQVVSSPPQDSAGTAFAIDRRGYWLTARHVVDGCKWVGIRVPPYGMKLVQRAEVHTGSDLALLYSTYAKPGLPVQYPKIHRGQDGFGFGFPDSRWIGVHMLLLGRAWQRTKGRYGFVEPVLVWSVHSYRPKRRLPSYGGMSGGPMLDDEGLVIGVLSSGSRRRGRLNTVAPATLTVMLEESGMRVGPREMAMLDSSLLTKAKYPKFGDLLRKRGAVSQIVCDVQH